MKLWAYYNNEPKNIPLLLIRIVSYMNKSTKQIGDAGEDIAEKFLLENGYKVVERNFRTRFGEIDIIAMEGKILVFIEVKAKKDDYFGTPAEMITSKKLNKIRRTAEYYIQENQYKGSWRIDAVIIKGPQPELIKNITR